MELKHIVKRAVRRWAEKIANKRAQNQAILPLPSGSDLSKRKAGRLGVAGSVAGHIEETTVTESRPEAFTRPTSRKAEAHDAKDNAPAHLDHRLAAFAEERYDLRHNLLTGQAEFRPKGQDATAFLPLTARDLNSLCLAAHEAGIPCWDRDVSRFVASDRLPDYHPFRDYFDRLPPWDGEDRLDALAQRVSDSALWVSGFRRWMLAVAAQWMGMGDGHDNSVAPVLVSGRQGLGKSTFCRNLLPPELSTYYTDSVDVANTARMEQLLVEMGLINLDEFDRIPVRRHPALKNVMQLTDLHVRKAYRRDTLRLPRIASFIATSNSHELLSDPSGSRRFLCVEVERPIDSTDIGHAQIYAQLKAMLLGGERYWFTAGEEAEIQRANVAFYRTCPAEEAFARHFRAARPDEEVLSVSLPELIALLRKRQPGTLTSIGMQEFSRALVAAGVERRHTEKGNRYRIVPLEHEGCKSAILSE